MNFLTIWYNFDKLKVEFFTEEVKVADFSRWLLLHTFFDILGNVNAPTCLYSLFNFIFIEPLGVVMFLFPLSYFISPFNISKICSTRENKHTKKQKGMMIYYAFKG